MTTYSLTDSETFTVSHARHIAAKVATDLKRMQRFYGAPSDSDIQDYEKELIELLKEDVLGTVTYGFRRGGDWIAPTLRYTDRDLAGGLANDDDPGAVPPRADITGASFYSYLTYNWKWNLLMDEKAKQSVYDRLPFRRGGAPEPGVKGYFSDDKTYSAGGRAVNRSSIRSY